MTRLILVGAGLANGLVALQLLRARPDVDLLVLEGAPVAGGNHTWSFHDDDLCKGGRSLVAPLLSHSWPAQEVRFPALRRRLTAPYHAIASDRFARVLAERLGARLRCSTPVAEAAPDHVVLETGERLEADAVIWSGGPRPSAAAHIRFQTFVGQELRFRQPHGLTAPIIMDATTPQEGGYRFTYVLPLTPDTALVEDTAYEDGGRIDRAALAERIARYCAAQGWEPVETLREEEGVLPITLGGDIDRFWAETLGLPTIGLAGGFFHPVTGYSLPDAVRVALLIAKLPDLSHAPLHAALEEHARKLWRDRAFLRLLSRLLFLAGRPEERWRVMQRFYNLPEGLIARFYAARLTLPDRARLLVGKPPVPILSAMKAILADGRP